MQLKEDTLVADTDNLLTYHETQDLVEAIIQSIKINSKLNDTENVHMLMPNDNLNKEKPASSKVQILSIVTIPPKTRKIYFFINQL